MNYKKPAFWIILLSVVLCIAVAVCFLTDPAVSVDERLAVFVDCQIAAHHQTDESGENFCCLDWKVIGKERQKNRTTLYMWVLYEEFSNENQRKVVNGSHIFTVITAERRDGNYHLIEYWVPRDGAFYAESIREKVPMYLWPKAMDSQRYIKEQSAALEQMALEHFGTPAWHISRVRGSGSILGTADAENVYDRFYLTIGAEGVTDIEFSLPHAGGGCRHADGSPYKMGERIWLEPLTGITDLRGVKITALNREGEIVWSASISDGDQDDGVTHITPDGGTITSFNPPGENTSAVYEGSLDNAITSAILDRNRQSDSDGLYHCASFVLLDQREICIDSDPPTPMRVTVYGLALHQAYTVYDGTPAEVSGSHIPVEITFEVQDGKYSLLEYWEPRDGSYYAPDIRDKFPDEIEEDALNTQKYVLAQTQSCYEQLVEYGGIDTDAVIEKLLLAIGSSPLYSSRPGDYIDGHSREYRELIYYGRYTLRYCFGQFLQGGQIDLRGHIMASACQDIADALGEKKEPLENVVMTGQDWFDGFYGYARVLAKNYSVQDLEKHYPVTLLLLQMSNDEYMTNDTSN